jgi:uncharacterized protein YndB with AHSA1/START domain
MSGNENAIEREIFIAAAPEAVFRFLVDPALMAEWIGRSHTLDPRPGGVFRVEVSEGNLARGVYTEVVPPRRVVFTWGWESVPPTVLAAVPPGSSVVEIDLEATDAGTLLRLRHSRLPPAISGMHGERWSHYLARLATAASRDRAAKTGPHH